MLLDFQTTAMLALVVISAGLSIFTRNTLKEGGVSESYRTLFCIKNLN